MGNPFPTSAGSARRKRPTRPTFDNCTFVVPPPPLRMTCLRCSAWIFVEVFMVAMLSAFAFSGSGTQSDVVASLKRHGLSELLMGSHSSSFRGAGEFEAMATTAYAKEGFVYLNYFFGSTGSPDLTCATESFIAMYPVNYCFPTETYAMKLQLTEDSCTNGIVQYFSDEACTRYLGTSSLEGNNTCAPAGNGIFGNTTMRTITCTNAPSPAQVIGSFVTTEEFEGTTCKGQTEFAYAFKASECFTNLGPNPVKYDCSTASPFLKIYEPADCTVFLDAVAVEDTCGPSADDDDGYDDDVTDDDGYVPPFINPPPSVSTTPFPSAAQAATAASPSSISYCPQRAPTAMPVVAVTAYPTSATAVPVSFRVMQTLSGIDASTFNSQAVIKTTAVKTIAESMTGITPADILDLSVSDDSRRRLMRSSLAVPADASVTMHYTVSATTTISGDQLFAELTSVVTSGAFNSALYANAVDAGATALQGCSSNSVAVPTEVEKEKISTAAIAFSIIGAIVGVALICGFIFHLCTRPAESKL